MITKSQIIVMGSFDDEENNILDNPAMDNADEDRTHIAKLGSEVSITNIRQGEKEIDGAYVIPVKVRKNLTVNIINYADSGITNPQIEDLYQRVREFYSPTGIEVTFAPIQSLPTPMPMTLESGEVVFPTGTNIELFTPALQFTPEAVLTLANGTDEPDDIFVHYLQRVVSRNAQGAIPVEGLAINKRVFGNMNAPQVNNVFISTSDDTGSLAYTLAHEIGHALTNGGHVNDGDADRPTDFINDDQALLDYIEYFDMRPRQIETNILIVEPQLGTADSVNGSKRFTEFQQTTMNGETGILKNP